MEMHQIRYFLSVAKTLNFTQAASDCNVAQPSLSRAIKALEDELGGALFRRERALSHLTDLGRMMLPLLTQCHESAVAAKALAASYKKGATAPLRIALSHTVNLALLVPVLSELAKAFSGLELQFFRGDGHAIAERLKAGSSELAVAGPLGESWERLDAWPLFEEGYELVVNKAHPLAMRNRIALTEMAGTRLISRPYCEQADELDALLRSAGIEQKTGDHVLSDQDMLNLLEANVGVAIMPETARGHSGLRGVAVDGVRLRRPVFLYAVAGRGRSAAATGLMKLLRAADWAALLPVARPAGQA
ncbi:LysR family transcriptional regulator [Pseudolabrys sp. FHR47]|uniref:LysR family transcriptional regulator n=1 Tax=Pseudolabrys sp. FHR47 TaxID=2562284 RepID=UPI0010BE886F|nr:LysR family transcriptional regulator [Pseudolabrys sp. FHR47]